MIALFSVSVYPARGGSTVVTEELAKCFGREEMIVVGGRRFLDVPHERKESDVEVLSLRSELNINGRGDRFFEAFRWLLFPFLLARASKFCMRRGCTSVVSTFPDDFFLLLGLRVSQRLNLPFFAYFHNTLVENRKGWRKVIAAYIQRQVFANARRVLVISDGLGGYYREKYPNIEFITVQHAFHDVEVRTPKENASGLEAEKTVILCGNINETNIDSTKRVIDALFNWHGFRIVLFTPVPAMLLKLRGIDIGKVSKIDYVPDDDFMNRLCEADLLVLTLGLVGGLSEVEYRTIFPTRTVPLLLSGRPILVHAPENSFLSEFIRDRDCGIVVCQPDEEAIRLGAIALTGEEQLMSSVIAQAQRTAAMFGRSAVRTQFLKAIS